MFPDRISLKSNEIPTDFSFNISHLDANSPTTSSQKFKTIQISENIVYNDISYNYMNSDEPITQNIPLKLTPNNNTDQLLFSNKLSAWALEEHINHSLINIYAYSLVTITSLKILELYYVLLELFKLEK